MVSGAGQLNIGVTLSERPLLDTFLSGHNPLGTSVIRVAARIRDNGWVA